MAMMADGRERVATLSQGFPHYTHLLAKHSAEAALAADSLEITLDNVGVGIRAALAEAAESIKELYGKAVTAQRRSLFEDVLLACALASEEHGGTFRAADIRAPLERVSGKSRSQPEYSYNLGKLCSTERGPALEKLDYPGRPRYRFRNPLLEPYVLMRGHDRGVI